jgi:hypothetical protein
MSFGAAVKNVKKRTRVIFKDLLAGFDMYVLQYDPDQYTPFPSVCRTLPLRQAECPVLLSWGNLALLLY